MCVYASVQAGGRRKSQPQAEFAECLAAERYIEATKSGSIWASAMDRNISLLKISLEKLGNIKG